MNKLVYSIAIAVTVLLLGLWFSNFIIHNTHRGHHVSVFKQHVAPQELKVADAHLIQDLGEYDTISVNERGREFAILTRTGELTMYQCSECHNEPLEVMKKAANDGSQLSHWNIKIEHANQDVMNCTTCHTANNMDKLHTHTGKEVSFNESYKLCMQCHQNQYKDWVGGAHGKKVDGWAKPVIKYTCVNCHNPHAPSFPHKMPKRLNTRMIQQRERK